MQIIRRDPDVAYLSRWLWVPKRFVDVPSIKSALTYEITSAYGEERVRFLYLWKEARDHLLVPRCFWTASSLPCRTVDCRPRQYETVDFKSRIQLDHRLKDVDGRRMLVPTGDDIQQRSLEAMMRAQGGILQLACGRGKTVIALERIARGRVPSLVLVDNTNLLYQWKREAEALLEVPGGIGIFGDGKKEWNKGLVLATYQSIANWADTIPEEARRWFGILVADEAHHVSAPTFSRVCDMFYGIRYGLTATPERSDGLHVISEGHIGEVLIKDLSPTMKPLFAFVWTGLQLDMRDASVSQKVLDIKGEVHLSKLTAYNGQWAPRMNTVLRMAYEAKNAGRMVMVLCNSTDEVMNLATCWERPGHPLYTDIPVPTPADVGEQLMPAELTARDLGKLLRRIEHLQGKIAKTPSGPDLTALQADLTHCLQLRKQHEIAIKIHNELAKRQRLYIRQLVEDCKEVGILGYEVKPALRQKFLATKNVIFAITKYGKEGLDCPRLDTVILSSLFSDPNGLQQLMGRPTRPMPGKKIPTLVAVVDEVGPVIGMTRKLMKHLREWPKEEGGPYEPILIGFPPSWRTKTVLPTTEILFGQS